MGNTYRPSDIERIIGFAPATLRDWRRRGLLADIGHRDPNSAREDWRYDDTDLLVLAILKSLLREGLMITSAIDAAFGLASFVTSHLNIDSREPDLCVVFPNQEGEIEVGRAEDIADLEKVAAPASLIINLRTLADELPPEVVTHWSA